MHQMDGRYRSHWTLKGIYRLGRWRFRKSSRCMASIKQEGGGGRSAWLNGREETRSFPITSSVSLYLAGHVSEWPMSGVAKLRLKFTDLAVWHTSAFWLNLYQVYRPLHRVNFVKCRIIWTWIWFLKMCFSKNCLLTWNAMY